MPTNALIRLLFERTEQVTFFVSLERGGPVGAMWHSTGTWWRRWSRVWCSLEQHDYQGATGDKDSFFNLTFIFYCFPRDELLQFFFRARASLATVSFLDFKNITLVHNNANILMGWANILQWCSTRLLEKIVHMNVNQCRGQNSTLMYSAGSRNGVE